MGGKIVNSFLLRITGLYALRPLRGLGFRKTAVGRGIYAECPLCGFAPAHFASPANAKSG